jgi:hypothetical protein
MTTARDTLRRLLREVRRCYAPPAERAKSWREVAAGVAIRLKRPPTNEQTTTAGTRRPN